MKKILCLFWAPLVLLLAACSKDSSDEPDNSNGSKLNTWTFKEGTTVFSGPLLMEASLSHLFSDDTFTFSMLGAEENTGYIFNLTLALQDSTFIRKNYQSGIDGTPDMAGFYYMETPASTEYIYKSSNLDPGPVMNYTITAYDASKDVVTIEFSGQAQRADGSRASITNGKVTAKVER